MGVLAYGKMGTSKWLSRSVNQRWGFLLSTTGSLGHDWVLVGVTESMVAWSIRKVCDVKWVGILFGCTKSLLLKMLWEGQNLYCRKELETGRYPVAKTPSMNEQRLQ